MFFFSMVSQNSLDQTIMTSPLHIVRHGKEIPCQIGIWGVGPVSGQSHPTFDLATVAQNALQHLSAAEGHGDSCQVGPGCPPFVAEVEGPARRLQGIKAWLCRCARPGRRLTRGKIPLNRCSIWCS